jgi:hypothetical protein
MYLTEDRTNLSYKLKRPVLIGTLLGQIENTLPAHLGLGSEHPRVY